MEFKEKTICLRDGRKAILRSPKPEDAQCMLDYRVDTCGETEFLLRYPEECSRSTEAERAALQEMLDSETAVMICCCVDGILAGSCQLVRKTKLKNRHRGMVSIALRKSCWSLGIGTAMLRELICIARNWNLLQVELEVIEGNTRAISLYEKMGFETVAATPNAIRLKDGTMRKEFLMVKQL